MAKTSKLQNVCLFGLNITILANTSVHTIVSIWCTLYSHFMTRIYDLRLVTFDTGTGLGNAQLAVSAVIHSRWINSCKYGAD